jgi:hypothetical protein
MLAHPAARQPGHFSDTVFAEPASGSTRERMPLLNRQSYSRLTEHVADMRHYPLEGCRG